MDNSILGELSTWLLAKIYEERQKASPDMTTLRASRLNWDFDQFAMVVNYLRLQGLIENVDFYGTAYHDKSLDNVTITPNGADTLKALGII